MKLRLFFKDPITYLTEGWQYVGMDKYCREPPCRYAKYCRGFHTAVNNCKAGGYQGARYDKEVRA